MFRISLVRCNCADNLKSNSAIDLTATMQYRWIKFSSIHPLFQTNSSKTIFPCVFLSFALRYQPLHFFFLLLYNRMKKRFRVIAFRFICESACFHFNGKFALFLSLWVCLCAPISPPAYLIGHFLPASTPLFYNNELKNH